MRFGRSARQEKAGDAVREQGCFLPEEVLKRNPEKKSCGALDRAGGKRTALNRMDPRGLLMMRNVLNS